MEESLLKQNDETLWYENDQLVQEYLDSYRKSELNKITKETHPNEKISWLKIMKNPIEHG